jgi:hypothetical protein
MGIFPIATRTHELCPVPLYGLIIVYGIGDCISNLTGCTRTFLTAVILIHSAFGNDDRFKQIGQAAENRVRKMVVTQAESSSIALVT